MLSVAPDRLRRDPSGSRAARRRNREDRLRGRNPAAASSAPPPPSIARYAQRTEQLVKDIELRDREERRASRAMDEMQIDYLQRNLSGRQPPPVLASVSDGEPR